MPSRTQRPRAAEAPSITKVAAHAGVSIATVSRILNGIEKKASPDTVARVRAAITELGYRPGSVGRALRRGRSRLVAVLAANLANPAMAAIAASAEVALREAGLVMVLCDTHDRPELQDEYLLEMRAQLVRGMVLLGAVESPQLRLFSQSDDPQLVFVNRRNPFGGAAPFVGVDNRSAGAAVADVLLERGARDLALIHGPLHSSATSDRLEGFTTRLRERGRPIAHERVAGGPGLDHLAIGYEAMSTMLAAGRHPPDGLFCLSDLIAYGAHRALLDRHVDPQRMIIFGFDDGPLNDWVAPWLNSVKVPYEAYGQALVEALGTPADVPARGRVLPFHVQMRTAAAGLSLKPAG